MFTTNEEDQREAAKLQKRLQDNSDDEAAGDQQQGHSGPRISNVSIDSGSHKYVLISAVLPGGKERQNYVISRRGAEYHRNVAEPFVEALERSGYSSIRICGGGRIARDDSIKTINIFGYSYGFGLADHALSMSVVEKDDRFKDYQISWSNDGY
jgi:phosphohistidine phosphatase